MIPRDASAAQRGEADRSPLAAETSSSAAELAVERRPAAPRGRLPEQQRGARRCIRLHPVVGLGDLDVPVGPQDAGGALDQVGEHCNAKRSVRRPQDRYALRRFSNTLNGVVVEAGRPNEDRDAGGERSIKAFGQRVGGGEVDENVAIIVIDHKSRIVRDD